MAVEDASLATSVAAYVGRLKREFGRIQPVLTCAVQFEEQPESIGQLPTRAILPCPKCSVDGERQVYLFALQPFQRSGRVGEGELPAARGGRVQIVERTRRLDAVRRLIGTVEIEI